MDYRATLEYLFTQLPMYQRLGAAAYKTDLSNTLTLCEVLENPEQKFKSVHVAGTNGKGSTSHMIASVLQSAGYKVGLYTSPHLKDFRERIKINGKMISELEVIEFVERYREQFETMGLSFFEWTVGLAFHYFSEQEVDIAVVETGLGGRLDSTNVLTPEVAVITNIGFDHMQFLGNTLEKIAGEKAGIIKAGVPVIIGERQIEIEHVFLNKARELNAEIEFADDGDLIHITDLKGEYQKHNLLTAQCAISKLKALGWKISASSIEEGFTQVVKNTGLMGRWQVLTENPTVICDTAHNGSGLRSVLGQLQRQQYKNLHMVIGVVDDKSLDEVLPMFPKEAIYYFCKASIQRALDENQLRRQAELHGLKGNSYASVSEALKAAKQSAHVNDLIYVGGSTFVVAEVV